MSDCQSLCQTERFRRSLVISPTVLASLVSGELRKLLGQLSLFGKTDRQWSSVFVNSRDAQNVMRVPRFSGGHGFLVTGPVTLPETLRNNKIKRLSNGLS
jgi:hypothetical protein